jgi:hypothetical protein
MDVYRYSKSAGVLLCLSTSDCADDREHERYYQALLTLDADAVALGNETLSVSVMLNPRPQRPNATWRRKYAELRTLLKARRRLGVIITPSPIIRGAIAVMNWLFAPPPEEVLEIFGTFAAGARWVEACGRPLRPLLDRFLDEACAEMDLSRMAIPALAG